MLGSVSTVALAMFPASAFAQDDGTDAAGDVPAACADVQDAAERADCIAAIAGPPPGETA